MTQRFYELLSYQIYGAVKNRTVAKMLYSEFCTYAPQTRFYDWEQVRPQMYHLHKPHLKSGYIEAIECKEIRSDDGTLDWIFYYQPGRKADAEYRAATSKRLRRTIKNDSQIPLIPESPVPGLIPDVSLSFTPDEERLVAEVQKFRVSERKARELVKSRKEAVERELIVFPARLVGTGIKNPSGLFIKAVEDNYAPPQILFELRKAEENTKQIEAENEKIRQTRKIENEKNEAWFRAKTRLVEMPEGERNLLWESNKKQILESEEFRNADQTKLKILKLALDGIIQARIIENFIEADADSSE